MITLQENVICSEVRGWWYWWYMYFRYLSTWYIRHVVMQSKNRTKTSIPVFNIQYSTCTTKYLLLLVP